MTASKAKVVTGDYSLEVNRVTGSEPRLARRSGRQHLYVDMSGRQAGRIRARQADRRVKAWKESHNRDTVRRWACRRCRERATAYV